MNRLSTQLLRIIPAAGFALLCTLCGVGLSSIVVTTMANGRPSKSAGIDLITDSRPALFAGGVVGLIIGVVVSVIVLRMEPEKQAKIEEGFLGRGGPVGIYFGVPVFVLVLLSPLLWLLSPIANRVAGPDADVYVILGVFLVVVALSLAAYDHIPRRFVISLSVIAWMLALSMGFCIIFFCGP